MERLFSRETPQPNPLNGARVGLEVEGFIYELPQETVDQLGSICLRNGLSVAGAIQQSIVNENFLEGLEDDGHNLIIKPKRGPMRYLVRS